MRRTPALALILSLLALVGLLASCSDDGEDTSSDATEAPATTETSEVFDPDAVDGGDDTDDDPTDTSDTPDGLEECTPDPTEDNEATILNDYIDCALPSVADDVTGTSFEFGPDGDLAFLSGPIDESDAVDVCEAASVVLHDELGYDEVTITVTTETDVVGDETGTPLAIGTTPGTCEQA